MMMGVANAGFGFGFVHRQDGKEDLGGREGRISVRA